MCIIWSHVLFRELPSKYREDRTTWHTRGEGIYIFFFLRAMITKPGSHYVFAPVSCPQQKFSWLLLRWVYFAPRVGCNTWHVSKYLEHFLWSYTVLRDEFLNISGWGKSFCSVSSIADVLHVKARHCRALFVLLPHQCRFHGLSFFMLWNTEQYFWFSQSIFSSFFTAVFCCTFILLSRNILRRNISVILWH